MIATLVTPVPTVPGPPREFALLPFRGTAGFSRRRVSIRRAYRLRRDFLFAEWGMGGARDRARLPQRQMRRRRPGEDDRALASISKRIVGSAVRIAHCGKRCANPSTPCRVRISRMRSTARWHSMERRPLRRERRTGCATEKWFESLFEPHSPRSMIAP